MPDPYRVALLFGPPGSGKGTQGKILGQIPGLHHLATGDMFRSLDPDSPLGRRVRQYSSRGELVPDDLTVELWQDHLRTRIDAGDFSPDRELLLLDGIPRSVAQAEAIGQHVEVLCVLHMQPPDIEAMVQRMKLRALREGRVDDGDENVIRRRFDVYQQETSPVLSRYTGTVHDVDPTGTPIEVLQRVLAVLVPVYTGHFDNPLG